MWCNVRNNDRKRKVKHPGPLSSDAYHRHWNDVWEAWQGLSSRDAGLESVKRYERDIAAAGVRLRKALGTGTRGHHG